MNMFAKYDNFMTRKQIKNELFFIAAQVKSAIAEQVKRAQVRVDTD